MYILRALLLPIAVVWVAFLVPSRSQAQVSTKVRPASFLTQASTDIQTATMPSVDRQTFLEEDSVAQEEGLPMRFGASFEVDYTPTNSGTWSTLADGSRLWRLRIECPGAFSTNLIFDQFQLPPEAAFLVMSDDGQFVRGAFTDANNKVHRRFSTAPVPGESCVLEYREPASVTFQGEIEVSKVIHGYRDIFSLAKSALDFGESGECNININCPEGSAWQDEKRAVAMIITDDGRRVCTGTLINNARQDLTPYLLTANHCPGPYETWLFMFGYESPSCENIEGPLSMTTSGAIPVASDSESDFRLVRLEEEPPESYSVFYAGWTADDIPADSTVAIHHPTGDIKKVSFDHDPVVATAYLGGPGSDESHWRVESWDAGTTEDGSSGCPLFDYSHRIIGQLHGGAASCETSAPDWFGRFSYAWSMGSAPHERLRDWLDPDSTGITQLDGRESTGLTLYHHPSGDTPSVLEEYEVIAYFLSDCNMQAESLLVRYQTLVGSSTTLLTPTGSGNTYRGLIPPQPAGTQIQYYVTARDVCGRSAVSAWYSYESTSICADLSPGIVVGNGASEGTIEYTLAVHNTCGFNANLVAYRTNYSWPTTLWDETGTNPLPPTMFALQGDTVRFKVRVEIPEGSQGESDMARVVVFVLEDDSIATFSILKTVIGSQVIVCGDVNGDLRITLSDITHLIDHVYISKQPLPVPGAANVNGSVDGMITLSDIMLLISHLYIVEEELLCP